MSDKKVVIIGAGASGMVAAIEAAKNGYDVTVLEAGDKPGKKIYATGNGKCNLTNENMDMSNFRGTDIGFIEKIISRFDKEETKRYFKELGLMLKDKNGYVYPLSGQASSVVYGLENKCRQLDVKILCSQRVEKVEDAGNRKFIIYTENQKYISDFLIIATGSYAGIPEKKRIHYSGYEIAKQYGHKLIPVVPSLTGIYCKNKEIYKKISGVRTDGRISLYIDKKLIESELGELQLTDYGVSGIPTFQLARCAGYGLKDKKDVSVKIDFLPDISREELYTHLKSKITDNSRGNMQDYLNGVLNNKLIKGLMESIKFDVMSKGKNISEEKLYEIVDGIKNYKDEVVKINDIAYAQVCAGGVSLKTIDENLESIYREGLYFTGEVLDADGKCGGYNLQWAWATGYVAGNSLKG